MALPHHVTINHQLPTLKGRIVDVPGVDGGIWAYDPQGNLLAKGFSLQIVGRRLTQPNEGAAPVEVVEIAVTKATAEGGRQTYKITQPFKRFVEQFHEVIKEGVGEDAQYEKEDSFDKLLLLTLAHSSKDTQHLAPTFNTPQFTDENGWYDNGELVCHAPVEINREVTTDTGEKLWRLRVPRKNGTGFDYTTCTHEELFAGTYSFSDRPIGVRHSIKTALGMVKRYDALSQSQKGSQEQEERSQPDRDAKQANDRQFRIHGWKTRGM